jgi:hypothetical protein
MTKYNSKKNIIMGSYLLSGFITTVFQLQATTSDDEWSQKDYGQMLNWEDGKIKPWVLGDMRKQKLSNLQISPDLRQKLESMPAVMSRDRKACDSLSQTNIIDDKTKQPIMWDDFLKKILPSEVCSKKIIKKTFINPTKKMINQLTLMHNENPNDFKKMQWTVKDIRQGVTYLHKAVISGLPEVVQILLANGLDLNVRTYKGLSPLSIAVVKKDLNMVNLLISHGADPNLRDERSPQTTPFSRAASLRLDTDTSSEIISFKIIDALLAAKADPSIPHDVALNGATPLHYIVSQYSPEILERTLKRCKDVNLCANEGSTPLCMAVNMQNEEKVCILYDAGAKVTGFPDKQPKSNALKTAKKRYMMLRDLRDDPYWKENKYAFRPSDEQIKKAQRIYEYLTEKSKIENSGE